MIFTKYKFYLVTLLMLGNFLLIPRLSLAANMAGSCGSTGWGTRSNSNHDSYGNSVTIDVTVSEQRSDTDQAAKLTVNGTPQPASGWRFKVAD